VSSTGWTLAEAAERVRVGLLIDRWDPRRGGAERALDQLAQHLAGAGHEVHVFGAGCQVPPPGEFHAVRAGGLTRGAREKRLGRSMTAAARGVGCDVTVGVRHLERVDLLWLHGGVHRVSVGARHAARRGRHAEQEVLLGRHRVFEELERAAIEGGARRVVVPSPGVQREVVGLYPAAAERTFVVEPGVDLTRFHPDARAAARPARRRELGLGEDARLIALPAANPRLKGLPSLLAALDLDGDPPHLVVAGSRRCPRGVRRRPRVHWRPRLDPLLLAAGADLVALPTWRDTFGLALVEALACGTPVVTSHYAGAAERVRAAGCRIDAAPEHPEAVLAALRPARSDVHTLRRAVADLDLEASLVRVTQHLEDLAVS